MTNAMKRNMTIKKDTKQYILYYSVYEILEQFKLNCNGRKHFSVCLEVEVGRIYRKSSLRNFVKKQKCFSFMITMIFI